MRVDETSSGSRSCGSGYRRSYGGLAPAVDVGLESVADGAVEPEPVGAVLYVVLPEVQLLVHTGFTTFPLTVPLGEARAVAVAGTADGVGGVWLIAHHAIHASTNRGARSRIVGKM